MEYPKLRRLFPRKVTTAAIKPADFDQPMQSAAQLLKRGKDVGRLGVRLLNSRGSRAYTFDVLGGDCRVTQGVAEDLDLEVVVDEDTWREIANGDLSPVDAFLAGKMEISGNMEFGKRQYAKAASRGDLEEMPF
jgi:putative sterol carrier protein